MAPRNAPAATSQTKLNNQGGVTQVPVAGKRKVTYIFKATSSGHLNIPYAVAINGKTQAAFSAKPKRVSGAGGKIVVFVEQGEAVSLYLNSDAHPAYRQHPVYAVTAGERDINVLITEKSGKHADSDVPVRQLDKDAKKEAAKSADDYVAPLTGDIWMKVSHRYTPEEVQGLLPEGTAPEVAAAVQRIYAGLPSPELLIALPATGTAPDKRLTVKFIDSDNPRANITRYSLLADGLTRVHPGGYAALFSAALDSGIASIRVTSCWRPMLGSIAHRAGLGLDVDYIEDIQINRQALRLGKANGTKTVTDEEVKRFKAFEQAIVARKNAENAFKAAQAASERKGLTPDQRERAQADVETAQEAVDEARKSESAARNAWNKERDANEPSKVRNYRLSLMQCRCVAQLFDPWFMEDNTKDSIPPEPNMQRGTTTSNERLHSHHLHITVFEPKIL
jgi:hypothetical protein